jgi:NTP pyrophosphatase (non-canonical NTP hydrolase)
MSGLWAVVLVTWAIAFYAVVKAGATIRRLDHAAMLREFHSHPNSIMDDQTNGIPLRRTLIEEESAELLEAIDEGDRAHIAREMADVLYVVHGTALVYDINLDEAFLEVHRAAMDKMRAGHRREDGKIIKPPGFVPPDMTAALGGCVCWRRGRFGASDHEVGCPCRR